MIENALMLIKQKGKKNMNNEKSVTKQLEDLASNICDNFCKYRDTCDENCECEYIRQGNNCPLDVL